MEALGFLQLTRLNPKYSFIFYKLNSFVIWIHVLATEGLWAELSHLGIYRHDDRLLTDRLGNYRGITGSYNSYKQQVEHKAKSGILHVHVLHTFTDCHSMGWMESDNRLQSKLL